ncbi:hypothetical protein HDU81_009141 [Chytriomyces hyalinus]|nr:hypothetical protein HDU81_009141 [Chytriomyces hyalinus]
MSNPQPPRSQQPTQPQTQATTATLNLQRQQQPVPPHPNVTLVQKPPALSLSLSAADQIAHALATSNSTYALAKVHFDPLAASIRRVVEVDRNKQQTVGTSLSANAAQFRFDDTSSSSSSSSSSGVVYATGGRFNMGVPNVNNLNALNSTAKLHATNTQTSKLI